MLNRSNPFTVQHFHLFTNYQFVFGGLRMFFLRIFGDLALFCFFQCFSSCFKFLILKIKKCKAIFPQLSYARVSPTQLYRIIWADRLRSMMIKVNWFGRWNLTSMAEYGKILLTISRLFHSGNLYKPRPDKTGGKQSEFLCLCK